MRNPLCWLFGCDVKLDWEDKLGGRRLASSGQIVPCPADFCTRCGEKDIGYGQGRIDPVPDRRNLYQRTIPVWLTQWRNRRYSKEVAKRERYRQSDAGRHEYLAYLDEQSKKLEQGLI